MIYNQTRSKNIHMQQTNNCETYENAVLGSVLLDPGIISVLSKSLGPEDFYKSANKKLYALMVGMHKSNIPIDMMTIFERAREQKADRAIGGAQRLIYLTETTPASANFKYYMEKVKAASEKRCFVTTLTSLATEVSGDEISVAEARGLLNEMEPASKTPSGLKMICASDITPGSATVHSLWGEVLYPSCITQINSEPGVGKTTFVYNLCIAGSKGSPFLGIEFAGPLRVLYIDVETPGWKRAIKLCTITEGQLPERLFFLESLDMHSQFTELLTLCSNERMDLVVFDTQSRIFNLENENDNSDANRMMTMLRRLVTECGCAVVLGLPPYNSTRF